MIKESLETWCKNNNLDLLDEWDYDHNDKKPSEVSAHSNKKVWWICPKCRNSYQTIIKYRTNDGSGCPYCAGKMVLPGFNDLKSKRLDIAAEWDYKKNGDLKPEDVTPCSGKKVWWICLKCGNSYYATISGRTKGGTGCPYCAGQKVLPGFNDLKTKRPDIAAEWDYKKNGDLKPEDVTPGSCKKVWWICLKCGNSYYATISDRTINGSGCPHCCRNISIPEKVVAYYTKMYFKDAVENYKPKFFKRKEIDIYIPSLKVGIEYDGEAWHSSDRAIARDKEKSQVLQDNGISLIRIRERGLSDLNNNDFIIYCESSKRGHEYLYLNDTIKQLLVHLNCTNIEVNINKDMNKIMSLAKKYYGEKSLLSMFPNVAAEWDYVKNGDIRPENVMSGSEKKAWWICPKCKNSYHATIKSRTVNSTGCPYCAGQKVLPGFNDLKTKRTDIAKEWDYEKNGDLQPEDVTPGSEKKAWWICPKCKSSYHAEIKSRASNGTGCPYCAGKKVLPGFNDLKTRYPELAKEWDYEKNRDIRPENVMPGTNKKVWWICPKCKSSYQSIINERTNMGSGCPHCAKIAIMKPIILTNLSTKEEMKFGSRTEAAKFLKEKTRTKEKSIAAIIRKVLSGKQKSVYGYTFRNA